MFPHFDRRPRDVHAIADRRAEELDRPAGAVTGTLLRAA
jgi:hypothetical protein